MPYGKRRMRRRTRRRPKSAYGLAKAAYAKAKKAESKKEVKHNEITVTDTTPDSTGSIEELSVITAGDTNNTREGDVVYPTSLRLRARLIQNASATNTQVRVIVFRWLSESPGAVSDILLSANVQSFKSQNNRYQSQILYDRVFTMDDTGKASYFIQKTIKLRGMIAYPEGSGVANRNSIWLLLLSNEAANTPTMNTQSRLYFKDA